MATTTTSSNTPRQSPQPPLNLFIQMAGAPGSGKSTMAILLQAAIGGVILEHDIIRSSLLEEDLPFEKAAKSAYRVQWALAEQVLKQGLNVIIDSTCNFPEVLNRGSALARLYNFTYWYIECRVEDLKVLDERLRTRAPMKSQRTGVDRPPPAALASRNREDSGALFKQRVENPCRPQNNVIIVDSTDKTLEIHRDHILAQIARPKRSANASDE